MPSNEFSALKIEEREIYLKEAVYCLFREFVPNLSSRERISLSLSNELNLYTHTSLCSVHIGAKRCRFSFFHGIPLFSCFEEKSRRERISYER